MILYNLNNPSLHLSKPEFSYKTGSLSVKSMVQLSVKDIGQIQTSIQMPSSKSATILGGRGDIQKLDLDQPGAAILKTYKRGGLARHFIKQTYLKFGKSRCQVELETLLIAKSLGVSVPQPIAFITKGEFVYQAWLITKEIHHDYSLAELCLKDGEQADLYIKEVARQMTTLAENGIYHVDLHPGNILIGKDKQAYFIDFDKARLFSNKNILIKNYINRWDRAVKKYNLPASLSKRLRQELLK